MFIINLKNENGLDYNRVYTTELMIADVYMKLATRSHEMKLRKKCQYFAKKSIEVKQEGSINLTSNFWRIISLSECIRGQDLDVEIETENQDNEMIVNINQT